MTATANYAYLNGRVSVLAEGLLPKGRIETLIDCAVDEEASIFQAAKLTHLDAETISDAAVLEQALISDLVDDFVTLAHALTGNDRDLLIYWARRFELSNLKAIIRGKMADESAENLHAQLVDIGTFATLPVEELLRTEDVAELLRLLESTPYADIARQARRVYEQEQELFALDAAIDRRYFVGLTKRAKTTSGGNGEALRGLIGSIIDRTNLTWLLRYRFAYKMAPAEAYYLLIPSGYHLDGKRLLELAQMSDFDEIMNHLPEILRKRLEGAKTIPQVDRAMERESCRVAESVLRRTAFNLARAFAYLVLRERDLLHFHAALKGKRLHIDPEAIRHAIGLKDNGVEVESMDTATVTPIH